MKDESELFGVGKLSTHCFPGHIVSGEVRPEKAGQEDDPWSNGEHAQPLPVHTGAKPRWQTWWRQKESVKLTWELCARHGERIESIKLTQEHGHHIQIAQAGKWGEQVPTE